MKKIISLICVFFMAFTCVAPLQMIAHADSIPVKGTMSNLAGMVYAPVNAVDMNKDTLSLTIEAEDMVSSTDMRLIADADASGGKAMKFTGERIPAIGYDAIQAAFPVKPNPDLMVNINIPEITSYQVWARVKTAGNADLNYSPIWHRFDEYGKYYYYGASNSLRGKFYNLPSTHPNAVHNIAHGTGIASDVELNYIQYPFKYRLKYMKNSIKSEYTWISLINDRKSIYIDKNGKPDYSLDGKSGNDYFHTPQDSHYILRNGNREFSMLFGDKDLVIDKIYIAAVDALSADSFTPKDTNEHPVGTTIETAGHAKFDVFPTNHKDFPEMKLAGVHPRLFITKEEIPEYKKLLTTNSMFASTWKSIKKSAEMDINGLLPENNREFSNNSSKTSSLQARALFYLIGEADEAHAKKTVKELKNFMSTVVFNLDNGTDTTYNTRNIGTVMVTAALVYDWCYDVMTYADREYIITRLKEMATDKEPSWPPIRQELISGHRHEEIIFLHEAIAAISVYDEDPEWYDVIMSVIYERMRDIRVFGAKSGYDHSAGSYFEARNKGPLYLDKMLHVTGGLEADETIFGEDYKKVFDHLIYRGLPNGVWFKDGDDYHWSQYKGSKMIDTAVIPAYVGEAFGNHYMLAEGLQSYVWNGSNMSIIDTFMFDPTDAETKTKFMCELPTTYMSTYPMTSMVARTGWSQGVDSPDAMVYMSMHDTYMDGHQHADTGTFQLWYKGMLALNAGFYEYGPHYYHYQSRSIANNVLLVDNHDQNFYQLSYSAPNANDSTNDGGQKNTGLIEHSTYEGYLNTLNRVDENGNITKYGENSLAYEKAHYIGPNAQTPAFSYLSSDISGAYNYQSAKNGSDGTVEKKLKDSGYERSMVFMDLYNEKFPAAFIVYDNVSALSADYDKTWLLHSEEEPTIDDANKKTTIMRTDNGLNGKLVNTTMYPKGAAIEKVGGNGKEFLVTGIDPDYEEKIVKSYYGANNVPADYYNADGTFVPKGELNIGYTQDTTYLYPDAGAWRVEISPDATVKTADDIFLNAMYVTDADNTEELPMTLVEDEAGKYVGVSVMDRIVTFSKTRENIADEITLTIPEGEDTVYCLLTDMAAGKWKVTGNGKTFYVNSKGDTGAVDDNTGEYSLCFEATPGVYTIAPTTDDTEATVLLMETVNKAQYGDFRVRNRGNLINITSPTVLKDFNNDRTPDYYVAVKDLVKLLNDGATCEVDGNTITINAIGAKDNSTQTEYKFTVGSTDYTRDGSAGTVKFTKPPVEIDGNIYMDFTEFKDILKISGSYNKTARLLTLTYGTN